MQIRKGKPPGSGRLAQVGVELSREARVRLAWMDFHRRCNNVAHTCRHFGISRQTFYRWQRRYDPYDLTTLEKRSHNYSARNQHRSEHTRACAARIPVPGDGIDAPADRASRGDLLSGFEPPCRIALGGRLETRGTATAGEDATSHECGQGRLWRGTEDMLCAQPHRACRPNWHLL